MNPPCTRMYTHPSFEATPPGAAPGPPVNTGARVRHFRGCNQLWAAWGATGQLSGIWLGLWVSASGGAAQSASIFITFDPSWTLASVLGDDVGLEAEL